MENCRKHRNIKLVTTERGRIYLVSESNVHTTKFFTENLLAIEIKKLKYLWKTCLFRIFSTRIEYNFFV